MRSSRTIILSHTTGTRPSQLRRHENRPSHPYLVGLKAVVTCDCRVMEVLYFLLLMLPCARRPELDEKSRAA